MRSELYAFGSNGESQLGLPPAEIVSTPTKVQSWTVPWPIKYIRGGDNHTLILTSWPGTVFAAGDNGKEQLCPHTTSPPRFEQMQKLCDNISFCAATCKSSALGFNQMWANDPKKRASITTHGAGQWGELGCMDLTSTTEKDSYGWYSIYLPGHVTNFAAGVWHYVAILENGDVYAWGKARLDQLGEKLSPEERITAPAKIEEHIPFVPLKVVCGKDFTYLVSSPDQGQHMLLGRDKFGIKSSMPADIKGWKDIGATWHAIFVLFEDGKLIAWGKENMWKLIPPDLPPIDKIAVGSDHILAVTRKGKLISWGWGKHGNCGDISEMDLVNDMVSGTWNEIFIPGEIQTIGAGYCTSFVMTIVEAEPSVREKSEGA